MLEKESSSVGVIAEMSLAKDTFGAADVIGRAGVESFRER